MDHLYASTVKVQRLTKVVGEDGLTYTTWTDATPPLSSFKCRLDLNFLRPGKDAPPAYEAGVAPDRIGVMFCSSRIPLKAGDRIVTLRGPVEGIFDILAIPDVAVSYSTGHHIEVQIVETVQNFNGPREFNTPDDLL